MLDRSAWLRVASAMFAVGWGANQFVPMLLVYRAEQGLSESSVTAMFGLYAVGLIPALLLAGPLSDRRGRGVVMRPVLLLSAAASLVLIGGGAVPALLYLGRFLAGVASGAAFSAGTAWVKELSVPGAGARRSTVALSAGFGGGPLAAGLVAQWLPAPQVLPYVVHLALMAVVIPLAWRPPETAGQSSAQGGPERRRLIPAVVADRRFALGVAPWAPWVFGTATIGFTTIAGLAPTSGAAIATDGALAGLTLLTGVLVQPLARRLGAAAPLAGLAAAVVGLGLGVVVAETRSSWLVPVATIVLGAAYGTLMVSGLRAAERLAPPHELAALVSVFYALTYVGFGAPYLLAELGPRLGYGACLGVGALIVLVAAALSTLAARTNHRVPATAE